MQEIKPMLAAAADGFWTKQAMKDDNFVAEVKYDGSRYVAHFEEDRIYYTSRRTSVKDGRPVEKGLNLPHINKRVKKLIGTVLDGEVMGPDGFGSCVSIMGGLPETALAFQKKNGFARYFVFDILYYKGEDIQIMPLSYRRKKLEKVLKKWNAKRGVGEWVFATEQYTGKGKQELYDKVVASGGEGIILKNIKSSYVQDARKKEYWIKMKKQRTWDVIITGFTEPEKYSENVDGERTINRLYTEGWIAAVTFGAYRGGRIVEVGKTSGMSDEMRRTFSRKQKKFIGRVMEVEGQELTSGGAIRHPRFIRMRDDKNPKECTVEAMRTPRKKGRGDYHDA